MSRLKNRQKQIPGGFKLYIPQTGYKSAPFASFDSIVNSAAANLAANPAAAKAGGYPSDRTALADYIDSYNAALCERMGWNDYIMLPSVSAPSPKFKALSPLDQKQIGAVAGKIKKVWQGVKSLNDWIESGEPAVERSHAECRAVVCVKCPLNGKGGLEEWFTRPAAEVIKKQFEKLESRKLLTSVDDQLGTCSACLCPLKLLVQTPLKYKLSHMGEETRKALDANCWVLSEEKAMTPTT
jgi:hypothetical protein